MDVALASDPVTVIVSDWVDWSRLRVLRGNTLNGTLGVVVRGVVVLMLLLAVILLLPVLELVVMVVLALMLVVMVLLLLVVGADEGAMAMSAPVNPGTAILARIHPNRLCKSFQFPFSRLKETDLWDEVG